MGVSTGIDDVPDDATRSSCTLILTLDRVVQFADRPTPHV